MKHNQLELILTYSRTYLPKVVETAFSSNPITVLFLFFFCSNHFLEA